MRIQKPENLLLADQLADAEIDALRPAKDEHEEDWLGYLNSKPIQNGDEIFDEQFDKNLFSRERMG